MNSQFQVLHFSNFIFRDGW